MLNIRNQRDIEYRVLIVLSGLVRLVYFNRRAGATKHLAGVACDTLMCKMQVANKRVSFCLKTCQTDIGRCFISCILPWQIFAVFLMSTQVLCQNEARKKLHDWSKQQTPWLPDYGNLVMRIGCNFVFHRVGTRLAAPS